MNWLTSLSKRSSSSTYNFNSCKRSQVHHRWICSKPKAKSRRSNPQRKVFMKKKKRKSNPVSRLHQKASNRCTLQLIRMMLNHNHPLLNRNHPLLNNHNHLQLKKPYRKRQSYPSYRIHSQSKLSEIRSLLEVLSRLKKNKAKRVRKALRVKLYAYSWFQSSKSGSSKQTKETKNIICFWSSSQ